MTNEYDVIVIGAGPSGAVASALLNRQGHSVLIIEKELFPRFSIGESLLPQCMHFIEEAGMLNAVTQAGFQFKNGAVFEFGEKRTEFCFDNKFTEGHSTTFQVQRAEFDKILADEAERQGVSIHYQEEVTKVVTHAAGVTISTQNANAQAQTYNAKFVLDASGFGRVLPRLLNLSTPSNFPIRQSIFTHIEDNISSGENPVYFDRHKILITTHPKNRNIWFWLIPFSEGRSSIGVVAEASLFAANNSSNNNNLAMLQQFIEETPSLHRHIKHAKFDSPVRKLTGYSSNVKSLWGQNYALLGNAGEFLDPIFSSGVTIAMLSASMAAKTLHRVLQGEKVCWEKDFSIPLKKGVDTFRTYVEGWYNGSFQDVIYHPTGSVRIKSMICSILAGYAWDETNPYVKDSKRRMKTLAELCKST